MVGCGNLIRICSPPLHCFSLYTIVCIANSGVIQGPPLDDQPAPLGIRFQVPVVSPLKQQNEKVLTIQEIKGSRPFRIPLIDIKDLCFLNAYTFHSFQIRSNSCFGYISIDPMPPGTCFGRCRGILKTCM